MLFHIEVDILRGLDQKIENRKKNFRIFCRTLTGNLTGNLFVVKCSQNFIFSSDRELNSEQDELLKKWGKPGTI